MALLEVKNLGISFGGLRAVDEFNVSIEKGELYGLIGPNGAGKTTVFNMLTGVYKPSKGVITLDGENITGKSTRDINRAGIARTFQNIRLFKEMSVLDNVKVGLHNHYKYSTAEGVFRLPRFFSTEKEMDKKAMELLHVFELDDKADFLASNLPYGDQRKLEIARLFDEAGFGSKKATEKFICWVKEYDPDIIHLNNIHGYYLNVDVLFKYLKTCGKKIIWTLHDCWAITGHSAYCDAVGCEKWKKGCWKCPQIKNYPKSYLDNSRNNWKKKRQIFTNVPNMTIVLSLIHI